MGYEIAEQLNWKLPDVIIYPTGGGTGLIGMWKAFSEMEEMGWIGKERPRMVSVQASGCAPIVRAFNEGKDTAEPWQDARTVASGLRVPQAVADFLMLTGAARKQRHSTECFRRCNARGDSARWPCRGNLFLPRGGRLRRRLASTDATRLDPAQR